MLTSSPTISPSTWWNIGLWVSSQRIGAVDPPRSDQAKRRASLLHRPDLDRGGVGAQEAAVSEVEGVLHRARGVVRGNVERLEVVIVVLDLGSLDDVEADAGEERLDPIAGQRERMQTSGTLPGVPAGSRRCGPPRAVNR